MSRRVMVIGRPEALSRRVASALDAAFDVDLERQDDALDAIRLLPNRTVDLFIVLADGRDTPGLDMVHLLREHRLHSGVPVLFIGGSADGRKSALAVGAVLATVEATDDELRRIAREALAIG